ncbi:MAG: DUF4870 domain-containing protein [Natrialbaceae archaeon]|nr:DUF4870 domain-containing protein [Natrialbaceae archaeon]
MDSHTLAALTHILGLTTWLIGPLVVLMVTENEFVAANARRAIDWQLMMTVYLIVSALLILLIIGIVMLALLGVLNLIFCVVAAVKATEGETWRYPLTPTITGRGHSRR